MESTQFRAWRAVLMADPCVYCGGRPTGMDHIHPQSAGGRNGWENRAPACARCDQAKGSTPLVLFLLVTRRRRTEAAERARAIRALRNETPRFYVGNLRWSA